MAGLFLRAAAAPEVTVAPSPDPSVAFVRRFITPEGADLRLTLASGAERASAFLVDMLIIVLTLLAVTIAIAFLVFSVGMASAEPFAILWLLGFFVLRNGYFIIGESGPRATTPGKRLLGLRVAARDGGRLTAEAVFVRNFLREIEVFLPGVLLLSARAAGEAVEGWLALLGLAWTGIFLLFPMFNRDRLRLGDIVAGTWVVKAPRRSLALDLTAQPPGPFAFTREQVSAYGVKELQVLESVLRASDKRTLAAVAERIRQRIVWLDSPDESDAAFLAAYYAALRVRLEHRLLFGHRRADKFDKA